MSIASAPSASLCLLSATLLFLSGCATPSVTLPEPPIVACEQVGTGPVADPPIDTTTSWLQEGPAWAAGVLGLLRQERALRAVEHGCLAELRRGGVIR